MGLENTTKWSGNEKHHLKDQPEIRATATVPTPPGLLPEHPLPHVPIYHLRVYTSGSSSPLSTLGAEPELSMGYTTCSSWRYTGQALLAPHLPAVPPVVVTAP